MPVLGKYSHRCDAVPMSCLHRCCVGLSAGLLALVCGTAAASQWRSGWGMAGHPPAPASDTATPQLQLRQRDTLIQVWVDHRGFGPVQVRLRNRQPGASPLLPLLRTLRGPGQQLLLELPAGPAYQLVLDSVPGQPQPAQHTKQRGVIFHFFQKGRPRRCAQKQGGSAKSRSQRHIYGV